MEQEFAKFYKEHFSVVYKYVYRVIQNRQIAEDIVQETFYTAYKKWEDVELHPSPQGWLFSTARNKILEASRKIYWNIEVPFEEQEQDSSDEESKLRVAESKFGTVELEYGMVELEQLALSTLDMNEWNLLKRHYWSGESVQQLAQDEGVTENNLRVRMSRILKKLRTAIGG